MAATWLRTVFGQDQPPGDLVVAASGGDQVEYLPLAGGQLREDLGGVPLLRAGEELDDALGCWRARSRRLLTHRAPIGGGEP